MMSDKTDHTNRHIAWIIATLALILVTVSVVVQPESVVELMGGRVTEEKLAGSRLFLCLLLIDGALLGLLFVWLRWNGGQQPNEYMTALLPGNDVNESGVMNKHVVLLLVGLVLFTATVLRIPMLDSSLWIDEVLTLVNYVQYPFVEILFSFKDDNQHLLFSLLARISVVLSGEEPWALRLPALVFGVVSIWMCFLLARRVYDERVALLSMLLLAISYHHVWYSQNARGYTMLLAGTLVSTLLLVRALQCGKWRYWLGFSLALAFCSFSHLTGVIVGAGQAIVIAFLLTLYRADIRYWYRAIASFFFAALVTVHGYVFAIPQIYTFFTSNDAEPVQGVSLWKSPVWMVNQFLHQFDIGVGLGWGIILVCSLVTVYLLCRLQRLAFTFALLSIIPAAFLVAVMLVLDRNLWPRLFFAFGGFAAIYLSYCAVVAGRSLGRRFPSVSNMVVPLPAIVLGVFLIDRLLFVYEYPKQDFIAARDYINGVKEDDDLVVGMHMAGKVYQLYYEPDWKRADTLAELVSHEGKGVGVWVVYTLPGYLKNRKPEIHERLESDYELVKKFPGTLGDGSITVKYHKPG